MLRWTKLGLSACLAALAVMAQIGPDEAVSNISRWWSWLATPPAFLKAPVIDALWTTLFLTVAVISLWFGVRGYIYWRRKLAGIKRNPAIQKARQATENPTVNYFVNVQNSQLVSINITVAAGVPAPLKPAFPPRIDRAFVKFSPGKMEIANSYNVSSISDGGLGDYTINFATAFATDDIRIEPIGTPPKDFQIVKVSPSSVRLKFDEVNTPNVALEFSAR